MSSPPATMTYTQTTSSETVTLHGVASVVNYTDPTIWQPAALLISLLIHFRMGQGMCLGNLHKWNTLHHIHHGIPHIRKSVCKVLSSVVVLGLEMSSRTNFESDL